MGKASGPFCDVLIMKPALAALAFSREGSFQRDLYLKAFSRVSGKLLVVDYTAC